MEQAPTQTTIPTTGNPISAPNKVRGKERILTIGLVACIILAIVGTIFSIYGAITSNNKSSEIANLKAEIIEKDEAIANFKNIESPEEDKATPPTTAEPQTNSYSLFANNLAKSRPVSVSGNYYHYTGSDNILRTMVAELDQNNHLKITDLDDNRQLIAEADDIILVYFVHLGNGGVPYFYMIHKDGKVSRVCINENTNRAIEKLDTYDNIVSVIEGIDLYAWLIDIDGNLYKTY